MHSRKLNVAVWALALGGSAAASHGAILTEWTFESLATAASSAATYTDPNAPEVSANAGTTSFTGVHAASASFSIPVGNGSNKSLAANTWAAGDYWQFDAGAGAAGLQVEFDQVSSSTGPLSFALDYTTNGGATFTRKATYAVSAVVGFSTLAPKTDTPPRYLFDFTGTTAVETAADVTFRLTALTAGSGTGGTDRVDNVTVGTALTPPTVPEPATAGLVAVAAGAALARRRGR